MGRVLLLAIPKFLISGQASEADVLDERVYAAEGVSTQEPDKFRLGIGRYQERACDCRMDLP